MPTPLFNFRLPANERAALVEMSKLYGAAHPSQFLREMVGAMCSGDPVRVQEFNARLVRAAGEQLILKLNAPLTLSPQKAPQPPARLVKPKKKRGGRRGTP